MHAETVKIDVDSIIKAGPIKLSDSGKKMCWIGIWIGIVTFFWALFSGYPEKLLWGAYYTSLVFFMGLAAGGVAICAIFQIVRARWSPAVRRIAEAQVAFLPWALLLLMCSWAGKDYLFPWGTHLMPGKEWWMQPCFVYCRFFVLLGFLFYMMWRYVRMSLRSDLGVLSEKMSHTGMQKWKDEQGFLFHWVTKNWQGSEKEVLAIQRQLSWNAPLLIILYALIYSLFAFEMIMAMDHAWVSNMFGGFIFVGNIYLAWAVVGMTANCMTKSSPEFARAYQAPQRWDLGKLTFGFCMLWGYLFFCQFLPQWYGNLPEETQWMILRTRDWDAPWIKLAWVVFPLCFIIPFVTLLSRDVKRTPAAYGIVAMMIFIGIWLEKYIIIMPNLSPDRIPFNWVEIGLFLGFFGLYKLSVKGFLSKVPPLPISHPLTHGSAEW